MIEVRDLSFIVEKRALLERISFTIPENSITGLIAPENSGKSVLKKILTGEIKNYRGDIFFDKRSILELKTSELAKAISTPPYEKQINESFSLKNFLSTSRIDRKGRFDHLDESDRELIGEYSGIFKLESAMDKRFEELTDSLKMKALICHTLTSDAKTVVIDNPEALLDPAGRDEAKRAIIKFASKSDRSSLLISNDVGFLLSVCDRFLILKSGIICEKDKLSKEVVEEVFKVNCYFTKNIYTGLDEIHYY